MSLHFHNHALARLKQSCTLGLPPSDPGKLQRMLRDAFAEEGVTEIEDATEPYRPSSSLNPPTFAERLRGWVSRVRRDIIGWFRRPGAPVHFETHPWELHDIFYEQPLNDDGDPSGPARLVNKYDEEVNTWGEPVCRDSLGQLV